MKINNKCFKFDPKKIYYDGHTIRLIIDNEQELIKKLKRKQLQIMKDLGLIPKRSKNKI